MTMLLRLLHAVPLSAQCHQTCKNRLGVLAKRILMRISDLGRTEIVRVIKLKSVGWVLHVKGKLHISVIPIFCHLAISFAIRQFQ
jgi:hypothetical protein